MLHPIIRRSIMQLRDFVRLLPWTVIVLSVAFAPSAAQFVQQGSKLVGTGAVGTAWQGWAVSLSADGNTAIVGGYNDDSLAGAAWVYIRSGGVWSQQGGKLVGSGAAGAANQGVSVSLSADGNTAIVGGSEDSSSQGAAWVYTRSGGVWTQQGGKLVGTGVGGYARQAWSVSLSADGNTAIVGGYNDNSNTGAAWVYRRIGGVWTQDGSKLVGTGAVGNALQGQSVSISADGTTAIVGGSYDDGLAGAAWVYYSPGLATIIVNDRWNLVSVPLQMGDPTKTTLFPTAMTPAYSYNGGYLENDTLENGRGYWMKFSGNDTIFHNGLGRSNDTVDVQAGWNLVGSLSLSIPLSNIGSVPGGIVTSNFYGYENGYTAAPNLEPGKGYWVNVSEAGQLVLSSSAAAPLNRIRVEDYGETPPPPPDGANAELPARSLLEPNYPNPFNPVTSIGFTLRAAGHVRLTVFNTIGQEVAVLVDEQREAGVYTVPFNAAVLPSGVYTYRITAGEFVATRKMLLIR
jgi:hypothetical protein